MSIIDNQQCSSGEIPIVILAGTSGAGKTTVAESISTIYPGNVLVLPLDNYEKLGVDCVVQPDGYIDWEDPATRDFDTLVSNISDLRMKKSALVPQDLLFRSTKPGDCVAITYKKASNADIVIVEGHLVLCDSRVQQLGTLTVFLDNSDTDVRMHRRLHTARDSYYDEQYFKPGEVGHVLASRESAQIQIDTRNMHPKQIGQQILDMLPGSAIEQATQKAIIP